MIQNNPNLPPPPPPFNKLAAFLLLAVVAMPAEAQTTSTYFAPKDSNAVAKNQSDEQLWGWRVCFRASITEISNSNAAGTVQFYYPSGDETDSLVAGDRNGGLIPQ